METVIASFVVLVCVIAAMAVGVMAGRKPIKGTCGGLNSGSGDTGWSRQQ